MSVGGRIEGNLVDPTVVSDCADNMLGMREEVFAPVAFTSCFATGGEVLQRAKDHKYGLRAAVYGGSEAAGVERSFWVAPLPSGAGIDLREVGNAPITRAVRSRGAGIDHQPSEDMAIPVGSGRPSTGASRSSRGQSC